MPYIANTDDARAEMLRTCGFPSMEEMWSRAGVDVPPPVLENMPAGRSEYEVMRHLEKLAAKNASGLVNFLGGGYYDHIIPAAVDEILSRGEFYTVYTPYQPECSQGTLQAVYEYQTAMCRLTGMDVSNASMYDGGTALLEAMMTAVRVTGRRRAVIAGTVSPIYRKMLKSYCRNLSVDLAEMECVAGTETDFQPLIDAIEEKTACVIVQYPNFFGEIEDYTPLIEKAHAVGALAVCSTYPIALALLKTPGELGFDLVTGEGQSLGIPLSFGGPYLGFLTAKREFVRKIPGRVVGKTVDRNGREGYVLTLQTREQHIRREHATSNICSNENLCALAALVYLTCLGKQGLPETAALCASKAGYARNLLLQIEGVKPVGRNGFFNEFVISVPGNASDVVGKMIDKGFATGFPLDRYYKNRKDEILVAVTEKRTREEIKALATAMEAAIWN